MSGRKDFIFKDEICDARHSKMKLICQKGTLTFTRNNSVDFQLYRTWCKGCEKIRIIERKDFEKYFKKFAKTVKKELEK